MRVKLKLDKTTLFLFNLIVITIFLVQYVRYSSFLDSFSYERPILEDYIINDSNITRDRFKCYDCPLLEHNFYKVYGYNEQFDLDNLIFF